jgi:hypothetical protein
MEPFLTQLLHAEAEIVMQANKVWAQQALDKCLIFLKAGIAAAQPFILTAPLKAALGTVSSILVIGAVFAGLWYSGAFSQNMQTPEPPAIMVDVPVEGTVLFAGGEENFPFVNPERAEAQASTEYGDLTAFEWWITPSEDETVLFSGRGGIVETELIQLQEQGTDGEYTLTFRMKDVQGATYTLTCAITIKTTET